MPLLDHPGRATESVVTDDDARPVDNNGGLSVDRFEHPLHTEREELTDRLINFAAALHIDHLRLLSDAAEFWASSSPPHSELPLLRVYPVAT